MTQKISISGSSLDNKIEKDRKKLFDRLRKLNKITSEEESLDQLIGIYNDISERTNCPVKYVKAKVGRYDKKLY